MGKDSYISVFIRQLRVDVRVGLLAAEKRGPQALDVSVELFAEPGYLELAKKGQILDYSEIHELVKNWESRAHIELLEPFLSELLEAAFAFEAVEAAHVSVAKPDIFDEAQQAGVSAYMTRGAWKAL